ncbi:Aldo/keto reductase [Pseudomonas tremae]|uniref:Aldo/keto reductase n=4 Tax=Pseudomonas syringae group TaxID=136849 RepID=A0AA40P759_9PSED|nr:Aldo/keto reductase [Pseudomonas coronafaciens pv. garcae]KPY26365.1 Aldo/keto reductase [Pseudomonas coronafaciens pv. porri]KPZ05795.1 Aldo/keto reductase [Pseudomonas tremae]RMM82749.1 Aldo/keto reductase [Pseudomonas coronafaciens pv. striafaciens]RMN33816.1 Aldo/keto reductase [Pseudomonas coronafaciens pv. zizaniae]RMU90994.1 Aldo/keto reductase [Pseudomonas coronafaciens pv. coronafaciens]
MMEDSMKYVKLGSTGLDISRLCLGCMTFGEPDAGTHPWTLDEQASRPIIRHAVEQGINFFDTANSYSAGTSETIVGKLLKEFTRREETVIATKVFFPANMWEGSTRPNDKGLSRKAIMANIDASLQRLGTDYIDLYQIHRWDYDTPIEETMEALHDVVKAGKARYIGASSMYAWQFAKAQQVALANGWSRFVSMQNYLNLVYREEEREMIPLCLDQGVGLMPWSPMARGRLTRPHGQQTERTRTDISGQSFYEATEQEDGRVIDAVEKLAGERGVPMAQIALAWVLAKRGVSAPIVGASKASQLDDAIAALDLVLSDEDISQLEAPYVPHAVTGFA